jgi:hypothetical protein
MHALLFSLLAFALQAPAQARDLYLKCYVGDETRFAAPMEFYYDEFNKSPLVSESVRLSEGNEAELTVGFAPSKGSNVSGFLWVNVIGKKGEPLAFSKFYLVEPASLRTAEMRVKGLVDISCPPM